MSDNNDINLLDDDLEDDIEYDLGNEDEDRLLADDYELQDSSELEGHDHENKNFVETDEPAEDDILDLGVTDGLDDLDSEIQESVDANQQKLVEEQSTFDTERENVTAEAETTDPNHSVGSISAEKNNAEDVSAETTTHVESEEEEESEMESRDRFKSERTNIVPLKSSKTFGNIPDSLDSVIPTDDVTVKRKWRPKKGWMYSRQSGPNMRGGLNQRFHQQQQQQQHYQQKLQPFHSFQNSGPHFPQMQQPPQKILINPHFRGAVQPHPDARLIWDREGVNNGFSQRMMGNEDYGQIPHGGFDGPFQQNPNPPSTVHPDGLHPHHHHQNQSYPPPIHASQQQPQYYNENYMEQPPTHAPVPSGPEPWLNHSMMQQPPTHHQIPPPQAPPDSFFMPPPRDPLMFPPPQQQFPPFQEQGPRFPPPGNFMPPPDMHMQGAFRVPPPGQNMGPGGRFRQPLPRFQKRRAQYQGPLNGPKRIASPKQQNVVSSSQHSQQPETSTPQQQPAVNVVPVKRLDSTPRRKKRMPDMSNLHEVKTVDTLPVQVESTATSTVATASTTNEEVEQEDEETREYRRKIEEQKRLREKVLQAKEIRRMMAALEKQRLLKKQQQEPQQEQEQQQQQTSAVSEKLSGGVDPSNAEPPKGNAIATIVNRNPVQPLSTQVTTPTGVRKRTAVMRVGVTSTAGIQRQLKHQQKHHQHFQQQHQQILPQQQFLTQGGQQQKQQPIQKLSVAAKQSVQGIPVIRKNVVGGSVASKSTPGMQPGRIVRAPSQQASGATTVATPKRVTVVGQHQPQARKVVLRGASSGSGVQLLTGQQQQRVVIQKSAALQGQQTVASANRTVVVNQIEASQQRTSKSVAVENLSVDTDEMKLRRMCLRVGTVEKVQMQPQHRRAIITFANPASAGVFIDRYQRKMVDLSLIQVSLVP